MFALSLALGALLCLAPSAAALDPQPEVPAPDTVAASQTDTPAAQPAAPAVPTLPQTGTTGWAAAALAAFGTGLLAAGQCLPCKAKRS